MRGAVWTNKKRKILRGLIAVFVSLLFGVLLFWGFAGKLAQNRLTSFGGYGLSVVLSGSMEPFLYIDDLVIIEETKEVEVGDVVVYEKDDDLIIHRVVEADGDMLVTQGDANDVADDPISLSDVRGKMVSFVPAVGRVIRAVRAPVAAVSAKYLTGSSVSGEAQTAAWVVEAVADTAHADLTASAESPTIYYPFSIRNYRDDVVCGVDAEYEITVKLPDMEQPITLNLELIEEDEDGEGDILTGTITSGGSYTFSAEDGEFAFAAGEKETHEFTLELSDTRGQIEAETVIRDIQVTVTAVQRGK
jgi:signal peptidase I